MLFPCSLSSFVRAPFTRTLLLTALLTAPAIAQVTGQPDQSPPPSSSTDVQTAQVVQKPVDLFRSDVAISVFAQYTNKTNGNFIRQDTTSSGGGMVSYRQSPRWWAGYEVNFGETKYSESYQQGEYRVNHNTSEITGAYLLKAPKYRGVVAFLTVGAGAIVISPSSYGGPIALTPNNPVTQVLPVFVYSLGVEHQFNEHFGLRLQYRADEYKAPNFKQVSLDTHSLRTTLEPAAGVYYRF